MVDRRKLIRTVNTIRNEDPNFTVQRLVAQSGLLSREISYAKKSCWWETSAPTRCNFLQAGSRYGREIRENDQKVFCLVCTKQVSCSIFA